MIDKKYDKLKLENQICFPLYVSAKEIIKKYKPILETLDLTYTQYITMMVLWEKGEMNVKDLGESLYLDSGTLTPVLKKLEAKNYLTRTRSKKDERNLIVSITEEGEKLKDRALIVPETLSKCVMLEADEARTLYRLLYKLLATLDQEQA